MNEVLKQFEDVSGFLRGKGIDVEESEPIGLPPQDLENFRSSIGLSLPKCFESYLSHFGFGPILTYECEMSNGWTFGWDFPDGEEIVNEWEILQEMLNAVITGNGDSYGIDSNDPMILNQAKAWKKWIPIFDLGVDGQTLSIDTASPEGRIVYHDTIYGLGANLEKPPYTVAPSFLDWIKA